MTMDELKALAEKATPGPYCGYAREQETASQFPSHWIWLRGPEHAYVDKGVPLLTPANGRYIAALSPAVVIALVDVAKAAANTHVAFTNINGRRVLDNLAEKVNALTAALKDQP